MQTHKASFLTGPKAKPRAWWQTPDWSPLPNILDPLPETAEDDEPEFRADLVARIRRQIADGTYGTDDQWDIAVDRLLRHLDEAG